MQFDEKWSFVGCKEKHCTPQDTHRGDCWDHTAIDPESRLVVSKRTAEVVYATVHKQRRKNRVVRVTTRVVFGTLLLLAALFQSTVSWVVNPCFVEYHQRSPLPFSLQMAR